MLNIIGSWIGDPSGGTGSVGTLLFPDNNVSNLTDWTTFNGYSNFVRYGDILDATFAAANTYFELELKIRNVPLSGTGRFYVKFDSSTNNREFIFYHTGQNILFQWYSAGMTEVRQVTWTNALTDTNEHKIVLKYNGAVLSGDGLGRCTLEIDGVVNNNKSLTATNGVLANIFNSNAQLSIGSAVDSSGKPGISTGTEVQGDVRDLVIRDVSQNVLFNGLDVDSSSANTLGTWRRNMNYIIDVTKNSTAYDIGLVHMEAAVEVGNQWYVYYLGADGAGANNADVVFLATKTKSDDVTTGWTKYGGSNPTIVFNLGSAGQFDEKQLWFRHVAYESGTFKAWYIGQNNSSVFRIGYATSSDGITWTRYGSNPIYSDFDSAEGITFFSMFRDADDGKYKMIYSDSRVGQNFRIAESTDGLSWTKTRSNVLSGEGLGWPCHFDKFNGYYYIWAAKNLLFFSAIASDIVLYRTADFVTFENMGAQISVRGGTEFGLTGSMSFLKKPNGYYFWLHSVYKNQMSTNTNLGEEIVGIKVAELNRSDIPVAAHACTYQYPSYVVRHYPLNRELNSGLNFNEVINGYTATINTTPVFTPNATWGNRVLCGPTLSGSQTITDANPLPGTFNFATFGVKVRVSITTTGTHELFKIGNDIIMTLVSGKLQVVLSADGTTATKSYISTANIAVPSGAPYTDSHIWVGFTWIGGVLTLYSDYATMAVTKTNDGALTNVFNSGSSIQMGRNAGLEMRSVSICSGLTNQQFIDLEI